VVFDIHFSATSEHSQATTNFARAIQTNGVAILGVDIERAAAGRAGVAGQRAILPDELLINAAAELGTLKLEPDNDSVVRKHSDFRPDDFFPTLSWSAAKVIQAPVSESKEVLKAEKWVNYYGPPGHLHNCSYFRALDETDIPNEFFRGRTVFVGARLLTKFSGERKDEYQSPYSKWLKENFLISGVEVHATMFLNLVRQNWLQRSSSIIEYWTVLAIGLATGLGLVQMRPWIAAVITLLLCLLGAVLAYYLFLHSLVCFPWLIPVAVQLPLALALAVLYNSFQLYVQNRLLEQSLARHLSPARVKQMLKQPELLRPGAEKQLLTIMFTDIADFTKLAEGMDSDELAKLMNNYFEQAISCVHETDGFLVKLIGDALFAIWNAPIAQADHQQRALKTALLLQERLVQFSAMRTRVGIHTGVADVGNFGSSTRFDYTAIGENINLASRLEGLNKHLGTTVLLSQAVAQDSRLTRNVGRFRLKGFEKAVEVLELVGEERSAWREIFAEALNCFQKRDWDTAESCFCRVLKVRADDGPARFYLEKITELRTQALPENWQGEIELKDK
jgi:adenylate cyclase